MSEAFSVCFTSRAQSYSKGPNCYHSDCVRLKYDGT
jgi:hypothetical protein